MGKTLLNLLAAALMVAAPAAAAQSVPSEIRQVTLFSDQALVNRTASAAVKKGVETLELEIEPFAMDPDSVSARVHGEGEILSVQYRREPVAEAPQTKIAGLEEKLRTLENARRGLTDRRSALGRQEEFLGAFVEFAKVQVPREIQTRLPSAEEMDRTLAFLDGGFSRIDRERQETDLKIQDLERKIEVVKRELASLRRPRQKVRQLIEILFRAARDETVEIETAYLVRNAFWRPLYKVSVPAALDSAELTLFARIEQRTGEDWNRVLLHVSSAVPLRGTRLPEAASWVLDVPRLEPKTARRMDTLAMKKGMADSAAQQEMAVAAAPENEADADARFAQARSRQTALSVSYELPRPLDLPSRDKETILPLTTRTLTGRFSHLSVPRQQAMTFLILEAESDRQWLAGPLSVYVAGQYVGKTRLEEKRPAEKFRLGMGVDRDVRVRREKIEDKIRETRFGTFARDRVVRELAYRLTAENLKKTPVTLNLFDSIPVSRTDRIQVRDLSISPEPTEENDSGRKGVLRWALTLAPGQSRTVEIRFAVVYPRDQPPPNL